MTSAPRCIPGRTRLIWGSALLLFGLLTSNHIAAADSEPSTVEELARLIALRQDSVALNPPLDDATVLAEAPNPDGPATVLLDMIAALDAFAEDNASSLMPGKRRALGKAIAAARRAFNTYGMSTDVGDVFDDLRESAHNLALVAPSRNNADRELVDRTSGGLARVAHDIAEGIVQLAENAGAGPQLHPAQVQLTVGGRLRDAGQYSVAIHHFGQSASFAANTIAFDIDKFEQNIVDAFEGNTVGYVYSIGREGLLYSQDAGGDARTTDDPPQTAQSELKEMYVASMSKTISAVALLQVLDAFDIPVTTSISAYLPSDWTQDPSIESITFRDLLRHTSGLDPIGISGGSFTGQTLESLEDIIAQGTPGLLAFSGADYTNANFSLMRILIPQITVGEGVLANYTNVLPEDYVYAELYAQYVRNNVLIPAGISVSGCSPGEDASVRTHYYSFTMLEAGIDLGDWSLGCGATGWYLSANQLGAFLAELRYTDNLLNEELRDLMDTDYLGWLNPVKFSGLVEGEWGIYRAHGGDNTSSPTNPGMQGCMMNFPLTVSVRLEASAMVNSRGGDIGGHVCTVLRDAYDNAWESD